MKHARADYDRIQDPAGLIPVDEPVFLIRAQDAAATWAIEAWVVRAGEAGASQRIIDAALAQIDRIREWQDQHGIKVPDMPVQP